MNKLLLHKFCDCLLFPMTKGKNNYRNWKLNTSHSLRVVMSIIFATESLVFMFDVKSYYPPAFTSIRISEENVGCNNRTQVY